MTADGSTRPTYPIGSVDSALKLLLLVGQRPEIGVGEAAKELGVARSTAHRLLQMLSYHGFVRQDADSKRYRGGTVLFEIGLQLVQNLDIRAHARPALEALSRALDETVQLFVPVSEARMACIDAVEASRQVRVSGRVGSVISAYESAAGLAVLAEPSRAGAHPINAKLANPAQRRDVEAKLASTRETGYAVERGGLESEVASVAAAISDHRGRPGFAVAIALPNSRLAETDIPRLGAAAIDCARAVADALPW